MRALIARLLGAELRRGEGRVVALFTVDLFVLLTAYYMLKVVREPLILIEGGALSRSYARGMQALALLAIVPAYSWLADRFEPRRLIDAVTGSFVIALLGFWLLARFDGPIGFAFFVWLGIFSTLAIAQFWSLANDLFTEEQGKRVFPILAGGGTLGAIAGAQIAARAAARVAPADLMLVAAALLLVYLALTIAGRLEAERRRAMHARPRPPPPEPRGGFRLVVTDRYLLLLGAAVLVLNIINTTGEYILAEIVSRVSVRQGASGVEVDAAREQFITTFYGDFQTWVSVLTAAIQFFLVARIFRTFGVRVAIVVLPTFALVGYIGVAIVPALMVARVVKVIENSTEYSLQNTAHQALFLPTSRAAKYKAKAAIDTLFVRLGDLASTGLVFVGAVTGLSLTGFAAVNAALAAMWLGIVLALGRRYRTLTTTRNGLGEPSPGVAAQSTPAR